MGDQGHERPKLFFYTLSCNQQVDRGSGTSALCRLPSAPGTNPPACTWWSQRSAHECQTPTQERVEKEGRGGGLSPLCLPYVFAALSHYPLLPESKL